MKKDFKIKTENAALKWTGTALALFAILLCGGIYVPHADAAAHQNTTLNPPNLNQGLVGHWTFDGKDMISNVRDSSGQGNTGRLVGFTSTTTVAGVFGQALNFTQAVGGAAAATAVQSSSLNNLFHSATSTVSLWFYMNPAAQNSTLIAKTLGGSSGTWNITVNNASGKQILWKYRFSGSSGSFNTPSNSVVSNKWYHAVVEYNDSLTTNIPTIYINGVSQAVTVNAAPTGSANTDSTADLYIGNDSQLASGFKGYEDDPRIYNRPLSAAEVLQLYNGGTATHQNVTINPPNLNSGLVGHWTFDGKDMIKNVADSSGQGNTGYIVAAATSSQQVSGQIGQALKFNGTTQYVAVTGSASLANLGPMTASVWLNTQVGNTVSDVFMEKNHGVGVNRWVLSYDEKFFGTISFTYQYTTTSLTVTTANGSIPNADKKWHLVTVSWDGSLTATHVHIYVDGKESGYQTQTDGSGTHTDDTSDNLRVGFSATGKFDDPRVYNRALSAAEVAQLYNQGTGTHQNTTLNPPNLARGLVGHWTFDGKDMLKNVADSSGLGNNLHMVGGLSTSTLPGQIGQAFSGVSCSGSKGIESASGVASLRPTTAISFGGWFQSVPGTPIGDGTPIYFPGSSNLGQNYYISIHPRGSVRVDASIGTTSAAGGQNLARYSPSSYPAGWHELYGTYDSTTGLLSLYFDGALVKTNQGQAGAVIQYGVSNDFFEICGGEPAVSTPYTGSIDDARIYNRALSAAEVLQLYTLGH